MTRSTPHANTGLAKFLRQRILELKPAKSQVEIATEAGFTNPNMLSMIKAGTSKLPLDRVQALARALDTDPKRLFLLAIDQGGGETTRKAIEDIFGTIVTRNEVRWLEELRDASGHGDPALTARARNALRAIFGK